MSQKSFQFVADVINFSILEKPQTFFFPCNQVIPLGIQIVRQQNSVTWCITAKKVFIVTYNNQSFGSSQFKTIDQFNTYVTSQCSECTPEVCGLYLESAGCFLRINNCRLILN